MTALDIRILGVGQEGPLFPEIVTDSGVTAEASFCGIIMDGARDLDDNPIPALLLGGKIKGGQNDGGVIVLQITSVMFEKLSQVLNSQKKNQQL